MAVKSGSRRRGAQDSAYRPGDTLRLILGPITNRGAAIARTPEGQAIFVSFGAPGEDVFVEIDRVHSDRLLAHVVEVVAASPERVQPLCPYFGTCGGCNYQHLTYEAQLATKHDIVVDTLRRIGGFDDPPVAAVLASPSPWFYRNQVRLSTDRGGHVGFTRRMTSDVLPVEVCYIVQPAIARLLPLLQRRGAGLHQIVVRTSLATGETLIAPDMSSRGLVEPSGQRSLTETVAGEEFVVSPSAFFQVNTEQAEVMVRLVRERLDLQPDDVLADLYAGVGFFSKILAPLCRSVTAVEISRQAAEDAAVNLAGLENVQYLQETVEDALPRLTPAPTKILLDPSREGCAPAALAAMAAVLPGRIVYVSCDAATLARDLARLVAGGYVLEGVQPLDMFPQTYHVECIATLRNRVDCASR